MDSSEFAEMMEAALDIAESFPEGVVYIGGIAVYMHVWNSGAKDMAEFTHDGDFYISVADMADLRDVEQVTANRRQSKHQLIKRGFEFDIYTESHSRLVVPYDAVLARSVTYDVMRVAGLEHLLVLKLEAYADRRHSAKGEKDAKDIVRIAAAIDARRKSGVPFDALLVIPYLQDNHLELLKDVENSTAALSICWGDAHAARPLRACLKSITDTISARL